MFTRSDTRNLLLIVLMIAAVFVSHFIFVEVFGAQRGSLAPYWLVLYFAAYRLRLPLALVAASAIYLAMILGMLEADVTDLSSYTLGHLLLAVVVYGMVLAVHHTLPGPAVRVRCKHAGEMSEEELKFELARPGGAKKLLSDPLMVEKVGRLMRGESCNH